MTRALYFMGMIAGCATAPVPEPDHEEPIVRHEEPAQAIKIRQEIPNNEITRGELPWWHDLPPGTYKYGTEIVVLAVGDSRDHHHIAEGFLQSKVTARLGVRRAAESIRFMAPMPEPALEDLFITRERRILAFYAMRVPKDAEVPPNVKIVDKPAVLKNPGRHRVGRHVFEGDRHLFLECDVEGPIANPDWGRTRAAARG